MPDRIVRQNILTSDSVNTLSWPGEVFYRRLMSVADDFGRYDARPDILRGTLYSLKLDSVSKSDVVKWLGECSKAGLVRLYSTDGREYIEILKFRQRLRAMKSKYPAPADDVRHPLTSDSGPPPETNTNTNPKTNNTGAVTPPTEKKTFKKFVPPSREELKTFFTQTVGDARNPGYWPPDKCSNQASVMHDHYTANGWVQGRGKPIKDWKAACRNWIRNCMTGIFDSKPAPAKQIAVASVAKPVTEIPKIERDINYLFHRYLEGAITVNSMESAYYDHLKKAGIVSFTNEESDRLRERVVEHIRAKSLTDSESTIIRFMKLFGVLDFFEQQKLLSAKTIFNAASK